MRKLILATVAGALVLSGAPSAVTSPELGDFQKTARSRVEAKARVALSDPDAKMLSDSDLLESGRVPNYLRALTPLPNTVRPFATLVKTAIYDGAVEPEIKLAMGLRIAQINGSPYVAIHMDRLLRATERGKTLAASLTKLDAMSAEGLAVKYGDLLTRDILGVKDAEFKQVRGVFNDSQIVELTMTTSFFNYFTRMAEGMNLPVEKWALEPAKLQVKAGYEKPIARVSLVSDVQAEAVTKALATVRENQANPAGLGIGFANSQRAFLLSPAFGAAWRGYGTAVREYASVDRELKLHVSFAVSMANGCRYCTLHQVQGLRRQNVSPTKLMQMKKDDSALTPRELTAVKFARKLTAEPGAMTDADFQPLVSEFKPQGALEVLLQTCSFAFMNRFTDGLRLPSEDEAIKTYKEVYGSDYK